MLMITWNRCTELRLCRDEGSSGECVRLNDMHLHPDNCEHMLTWRLRKKERHACHFPWLVRSMNYKSRESAHKNTRISSAGMKIQGKVKIPYHSISFTLDILLCISVKHLGVSTMLQICVNNSQLLMELPNVLILLGSCLTQLSQYIGKLARLGVETYILFTQPTVNNDLKTWLWLKRMWITWFQCMLIAILFG